MGSIEVFPGRGKAPAAPVRAWRAVPVAGSAAIQVRAARIEDFAAVRALQKDSMPPMPEASLRQFEGRIAVFPEGQLVATVDGEVVGAAGALIVGWDLMDGAPTWGALTADGSFATHDERARTLYAAESLAEASRRGFGIARALAQAQRRLCRRKNLERLVATARLPGYGAVRSAIAPERYAMRVVWGDVPEPMLRLRLAQGFHYCGILRDFLPEDAESCGHAALLAWLNPLYAPPGPGANAASERARKCA